MGSGARRAEVGLLQQRGTEVLEHGLRRVGACHALICEAAARRCASRALHAQCAGGGCGQATSLRLPSSSGSAPLGLSRQSFRMRCCRSSLKMTSSCAQAALLAVTALLCAQGPSSDKLVHEAGARLLAGGMSAQARADDQGSAQAPRLRCSDDSGRGWMHRHCDADVAHLAVVAHAAGVGGKHGIGQARAQLLDEALRQRRPRQHRARARVAHAGHKHQPAALLRRQGRVPTCQSLLSIITHQPTSPLTNLLLPTSCASHHHSQSSMCTDGSVDHSFHDVRQRRMAARGQGMRAP